MNVTDKFVKKLETWQRSGKMNWGRARGEDPRIFRKRKTKSCYCGWHSQGKETFNPDQTKYWRKNKRMHWRRLLRKFVVRRR